MLSRELAKYYVQQCENDQILRDLGNTKELITIEPRKSANLTFRNLIIENILITSNFTSQKAQCFYIRETTSE